MSIPSGCTFSECYGSLGSRRSRTPTLSTVTGSTVCGGDLPKRTFDILVTLDDSRRGTVRLGQTNCRRWLTPTETISQDDVVPTLWNVFSVVQYSNVCRTVAGREHDRPSRLFITRTRVERTTRSAEFTLRKLLVGHSAKYINHNNITSAQQ